MYNPPPYKDRRFQQIKVNVNELKDIIRLLLTNIKVYFRLKIRQLFRLRFKEIHFLEICDC